MGKDAQYQAIPEDCELLLRARQDRRWAEALVSFHGVATIGKRPSPRMHTFPEFVNAVLLLVEENPGITQRYFIAVSRQFDAIMYLLSSARRAGESWKTDQSSIRKVIYGNERLHPEALATQGRPIGFVPANSVASLSDYLAGITREKLHQHYDPQRMFQAGIYKMGPNASEKDFQIIWEEFAGMQNIYQQAAAHGEAMITVVD